MNERRKRNLKKRRKAHVKGHDTGRDMVEHKRIKKEPAESEQTYHDLVDHAAVGMATVDLKGRFTYVNKVAADFIGHHARDLIGRSFKDYVHPEDRSRITRLFQVVLLRRPPTEVELRGMGPKGSVRQLLMRPWPVRAGGKTVGFSAVLIDITERRWMEDELRRSEERFRKVFRSTPIPALITSIEGPIVDVNDAWVRMSGYGRKEALGHSTIELGMMLDLGQRDRILKDLLEKGRLSNVEMTRRTKSGELRDILNTLELVELDGKKCILNMQVDITERKQTEDALRASEEQYRSLLEATMDAVSVTIGTKFVYVNERCAKLLGFDDSSQLIGRDFADYIAPEDREIVMARTLARERGELVPRMYEFKIQRRDGIKVPVETHATAVEYEGRKAVLSFRRDITERKQMEEKLDQYSRRLEQMVEDRTKQLWESEEKFRRIYNASLNAIYTTTLGGEVVDMNPAGVSMLRFNNLDELRQVNIGALYVNPEDRKRLIELANKGPVTDFETQLKRRDGAKIDVIVNCYALRNEQGKITGLQGAVTDITESRRMERLRNEFVADVTDELLTPLVSMKGYIDYILKDEKTSLPEETLSSLHAAKRNTDRLLDLTNALVDIRRMESGRLKLNLQPLDLREIVEQCVRETQTLTTEKQSLRIELPEGPLRIQGDQARVSQILMNLLSNALKYTREGEIVLRAKAAGDSIEVQVSDAGIGIRKEDLARVFEPFAAIQKPTYVKGSGLGLSITKGLAEAHGGKIWAESPGEGKGATFTFTLPRKSGGN